MSTNRYSNETMTVTSIRIQ